MSRSTVHVIFVVHFCTFSLSFFGALAAVFV